MALRINAAIKRKHDERLLRAFLIGSGSIGSGSSVPEALNRFVV